QRGEDPADRVRAACGAKPQAARARQAGNLRLPGLHLHLRQIPSGRFPDQTEDPARPHAGEVASRQTGTATAHASADQRAGKMAEADRHRILQLPCGADQQSGACGFPLPRRRNLAAYAPAAQPEGPHELGTDYAAGRRLAPPTTHPASLATGSLRRHPPEVGAVCGKAARTDLCGGRSAMSVPTANAGRRARALRLRLPRRYNCFRNRAEQTRPTKPLRQLAFSRRASVADGSRAACRPGRAILKASRADKNTGDLQRENKPKCKVTRCNHGKNVDRPKATVSNELAMERTMTAMKNAMIRQPPDEIRAAPGRC